MDNTDRENSFQDIQKAKTGIIWKERDDTWSGKLLAAGLTKILITTNEKTKRLPRHQRTSLIKQCVPARLVTAPKTYAGDIKAFANSRSLREKYFHFANA
jgi:hypothetical protein